MKNIAGAIEREVKFMNDSDEGTLNFPRGYLHALEILAEVALEARGDSTSGKQTCSAAERLQGAVELQTEPGLFGLRTSPAKPSGAARTKKVSSGGNRANRAPSRPLLLPRGKQAQDLALKEPITRQEQEQLRIALGVLRSGTDYADFLTFWLEDYGQQILSPNPPHLFSQSCQA